MSASSMAIGARPAPVAGATRARAPNARARSLTSASRVITTSKRRLARADTHVVFAAADSPTGEADKDAVVAVVAEAEVADAEAELDAEAIES